MIGITQASSKVNLKCMVNIKSRVTSFKLSCCCLVVPNICGYIPAVNIDKDAFKVPTNIPLADPRFYESAKIDILLGSDCFWQILDREQISLGKHLPCIQNTKFGWTVAGPYAISSTYDQIQCNFSKVSNEDLLQQLARFWEVEQGPSKKSLSEEELSCESHFIENTKRSADVRFIVEIPLKESVSLLGESRDIAVSRFLSLEKRLQTNPMMYSMYKDFMEEYLSLGHMSRSQHVDASCVSYYLPHHGVLKQDSLTTKLRVVFNASMPTSSGYSLNDLQMVGPIIQQDLFSILVRFRKYKYVISADVEKMYWQVSINPSQRCLQKIVWRSSPTEPLQEFELNTVTYGTASAPYLAIRCLYQLGLDCAESHPLVSKIICNDFYVDDLLSGTDDLDEAKYLCRTLSQIVSQGCFKLRKWISNNKDIFVGMQDNDIHPKLHQLGSKENTKTLGIMWNCQEDVLMYRISKSDQSQPTKRSVLSETAQVFDPLGVLSPVTIIAKIYLRRLWELKLSWDEVLPINLQATWTEFRSDLYKLNWLKVPRNAFHSNYTNLELHAFSDASNQAYGGCIYVRATHETGNVSVILLCAKSRVSPIKPLTIPKLELCGVVTVAKLLKQTIDALGVTVDRIVIWTDLSVVLGWLKTPVNRLKVFVANRVANIHELAKNVSFRHVASEDNPADILSRGKAPSQLIDCDLWWSGPQ